MGASDKDMQQGTILVFEMKIVNLKGFHGKGTKREENPYLFDDKILNFFPKTSPKKTYKPP